MLGYQITPRQDIEGHPRTAIANICVPFNFSECAYTGLTYGARLAKLLNAQLTILNCFQSTSLNSGSATDVEYTTNTYERKEEILDNVPLLKELNCNFMVEHTYLTEILPQLSSDNKIDMVLMGSQISGNREKLFGTNASSLINHIDVPLMVIPDHLEEIKLDHIMFAADYKDFDDLTKFRLLKAMANMTDANIHIVHIDRITSPTISEEESKVEHRLEKFFDGVDHEVHDVKSSTIHDGLNEFANDYSIDMIAMVPRKHGFLESLYRPSETKKMAMDTSRPLLIFHQ